MPQNELSAIAMLEYCLTTNEENTFVCLELSQTAVRCVIKLSASDLMLNLAPIRSIGLTDALYTC
ncbi:hypothetical protein BV378_05370 [Nostoc sp. RF31YmG]|nr:hypothetical protein BV378_05370 [Nostoc sp. RF31YmG]